MAIRAYVCAATTRSCTWKVSAVEPDLLASTWIVPASVRSQFTAAGAVAGMKNGLLAAGRITEEGSKITSPIAKRGEAVGTNVDASPLDSMINSICQEILDLEAPMATAAEVARIVPPASVGVPI